MSTLVEAFSVVIPRHVLDAGYPGGTDGYLDTARRARGFRYAVSDERLACVSFNSPAEAEAFIEPLTALGLASDSGEGSSPAPIACVDEDFGPTSACPWLRWRRHSEGYTSCWLEWTEPGELSAPEDWLPRRQRAIGRQPSAQPTTARLEVSLSVEPTAADDSAAGETNAPPPIPLPFPLPLRTPRHAIGPLTPISTPAIAAAASDLPTNGHTNGNGHSDGHDTHFPELEGMVTLAEPSVYVVAATEDGPGEPVQETGETDLPPDAWALPEFENAGTGEDDGEDTVDDLPEAVGAPSEAPTLPEAVTAAAIATDEMEETGDEVIATGQPDSGAITEAAVFVDPDVEDRPDDENTIDVEGEIHPGLHHTDPDTGDLDVHAGHDGGAEAVEATPEAMVDDVVHPSIADASIDEERPALDAHGADDAHDAVEALFRGTDDSPEAAPSDPYRYHASSVQGAEPTVRVLLINNLPTPIHMTAIDVATSPSLDAVRSHLAERGWRYSEDGNQPTLFFQLTGVRASYPGFAAADEGSRLVWLYTQLPIRVPDHRRAAAVELLTRVNHGLPVGNFEFDYNDGEVRFKTVADTTDGCFSADAAGRLMRHALEACDRYHDALMQLIYGGLSAEEALRQAASR